MILYGKEDSLMQPESAGLTNSGDEMPEQLANKKDRLELPLKSDLQDENSDASPHFILKNFPAMSQRSQILDQGPARYFGAHKDNGD